MEINRYVFGTAIDGSYRQLFASDTLRSYLVDTKQAYDVRTTMEKCVAPLFLRYTALADAQRYAKKDKPLYTQYVPLHLSEVDGMNKKMLPFGGWGVCGPENSGNEGIWADESRTAGRETYYTQIEMFDLEELYDSTEYNHLDILFGMSAMTDLDVKQLRVESGMASMIPRVERVAPTMRQEDKAHVIAAVRAMYDKKAVVIHLEKGVSFTQRSRELLMQIYSMLPPIFAKEVGYASYCNPKSISGLTNAWSIRVFVVPGEEPVQAADFPQTQFKVLEMSAPEAEAMDDMWKILSSWWALSWDERIAVMRQQFKDTEATYHRQDTFLEISTQYFRKLQDFRVWRRSVSFQDLRTLEELRREYNKYSFWEDIPGAKVQFASRARRALEANGLSLKALTADAFVASQRETDDAKRTLLNRQYVFGDRLSKLTPKDVYTAVEGYIDQDVQRKMLVVVQEKDRIIREKESAIESQKQAYDSQIENLKSAHQTDLDTQQQKFDSDMEVLKKACTEAVAAIKQTLEKKETELAGKDAEKQKALEDQKQLHDTEVDNLKKAHEEAVDEINQTLEKRETELAGKDAEKQKALEDQKQLHDAEVEKLKKTHDADVAVINETLKLKEQELADKDKALEDKDRDKRIALESEQRKHESEIQNLKEQHQSDIQQKDGIIQTKDTIIHDKEDELTKTRDSETRVKKENKKLANELAVYKSGKTGLPALIALVFPSENTRKALPGPSGEYGTIVEEGKTGNRRKNPPRSFWQDNQMLLIPLIIGLIVGLIAGACIGAGFRKDDPVKPTDPVIHTEPTPAPPTDPPTVPPTEPKPMEAKPTEPQATEPPASWLTDDLAAKLRDGNEDIVTFMLPDQFPEGKELNALALISDKQIGEEGIPACYVLALNGVPENKDDLYAYITYDNICLAVFQSKCTDHSMRLAIKLMAQIMDMNINNHQYVQMYVRLDKTNKELAPIAIGEPFRQKLNTDDWLEQVTGWYTGSDTDAYREDACMADGPALVVTGADWTMYFSDRKTLTDDPETLQKTREEKFKNNNEDWGDFWFLFEVAEP